MPRGKKKEANGNGHSISYKIGKREGGSVVFSGIEDPEKVPEKVTKTLEKFGLSHSEGLKWQDETLPVGDDVYTELEGLARCTNISVFARPTNRGGVVYKVSIGGAEACCGKSLTDALVKAHRAWNRGGRVVGGKRLEATLSSIVPK